MRENGTCIALKPQVIKMSDVLPLSLNIFSNFFCDFESICCFYIFVSLAIYHIKHIKLVISVFLVNSNVALAIDYDLTAKSALLF